MHALLYLGQLLLCWVIAADGSNQYLANLANWIDLPAGAYLQFDSLGKISPSDLAPIHKACRFNEVQVRFFLLRSKISRSDIQPKVTMIVR